MLLNRVLGIKKGDIISIVGSGGKTTLMYLLAKELSGENKILTTTTTKIYLPTKEQVDFIAIGEKDFNNIRGNRSSGIYSCGKYINSENKLVGIEKDRVKEFVNSFDLILIESDGSKGKSIKGWNNSEPVICYETNVTIGVIGLESFGMIINEKNIHRIDKFIDVTNGNLGEKINITHFIKIIFDNNGLFKWSKGRKILFLNKEEKISEENLKLLINEIIKENNKCDILDRVVVGSLKNRTYHLVI